MVSRYAATLVTLLWMTLLAHEALSEDDTLLRAGKIRAALVYYIIKFVDRDHRIDVPLTVCTLGSDPLIAALPATFENKSLNGRSFEVKSFSAVPMLNELQVCQVMFFGNDRIHDGLALIKDRSDHPPLVICAVPSIDWNGCGVEIYEESNKARIALDNERLESDGFKIGSELLEVSVVRKQKANANSSSVNR